MTTTTTTGPRKGLNTKPARIGLERNFDISFIAEMALREKQIQQNYRPIISVHKWFARRPGTLFRGLLLSEFNNTPLRENYFKANDLSAIKIADPFMGGGTPLIEANRLGCDVTGFDINPMAYWIVREEIEHLDIATYQQEAQNLIDWVKNKIGSLYTTRCLCCGREDANVKYFLWVKTLPCQKCGTENNLFPGYRIAEARRHPKNVFVCPHCGELTESASAQCICKHCAKPILERGIYNPEVELAKGAKFVASSYGNTQKIAVTDNKVAVGGSPGIAVIAGLATSKHDASIDGTTDLWLSIFRYMRPDGTIDHVGGWGNRQRPFIPRTILFCRQDLELAAAGVRNSISAYENFDSSECV